MKNKRKLIGLMLLNFIIGSCICIIIQHVFKCAGIDPQCFMCGYLVCFVQMLYVIKITFYNIKSTTKNIKKKK